MVLGRHQPVSREAEAQYAADTALAERFPELLEMAREAEQALRRAQVAAAALPELRKLALNLDDALTAAMRAAYASERAEIGPRGYEDWICRRKAKAKPAVRAWAAEAERLLTLRESHRLTGIPRIPPVLVA
jgi:hypothetical protein